ncbi:MBL fold metallo-hydrolase [Pueribacillus theae]|uniref:MBL fold metallo-hydrolase n=1 Tax=Pueribacillus theae TaxID=2171751 RepID=UPI00140226B7|nr:MBL fold metallo-hydrolase [Pueribacillus theae]
MTYTKIGPIEILTGENKSKIPFSTSLLVHGRDETALIDCGTGHKAYDYIKNQKPLKNIYLTHYHLDHISGIGEFPEAQTWINPYDKHKLKDLHELTKANGLYAVLGEEGAEDWIKKRTERNNPVLNAATNVDMNVYPYELPLQIAGEKMIMIHAPGHTEGLALPYFPDHGILFVVDIDLSSFGPWYNNIDSDIDLFIQSALKTLEVDAEYFVTSHHKGMVRRKEYEQKLHDYLAIIEKREQKLIDAIDRGISPEDIVYEEVFYFKETHKKSPLEMTSEIIGIVKHLQRLIKNGGDYEDYYNEFITTHHLIKEYLFYKKEPHPADHHPLMTKTHSL